MFRNMDRLIAYLDGPASASPRLRVRYATLSEYFELLRERIDVASVRPRLPRPFSYPARARLAYPALAPVLPTHPPPPPPTPPH